MHAVSVKGMPAEIRRSFGQERVVMETRLRLPGENKISIASINQSTDNIKNMIIGKDTLTEQTRREIQELRKQSEDLLRMLEKEVESTALVNAVLPTTKALKPISENIQNEEKKKFDLVSGLDDLNLSPPPPLRQSLPPTPKLEPVKIREPSVKIIHSKFNEIEDAEDDSCSLASRVNMGTANQKSPVRLAAVDPETARKCTTTDFFFLDHYFDLLTYLQERKQRIISFKEHAQLQRWPADQYQREWQQQLARESAFLRKRRTRTNLIQFTVLKQIGQGGYGQVFLVRKKDTDEVCALKKMSKIHLKKMNEVNHILTERDILTQTRSEWLTRLLYAFQDFEHVYLAMEYVPGGDMRTMMNKAGILHEPDAMFYMAEMFVAVNELHKLGYLHRDLKPENFLIDSQGHLKLTDFGLSKGQLASARVESLKEKLIVAKDAKLVKYTSLERKSFHQSLREHWDEEHRNRAFSLVGSPDYMAPEILQNSNHSGRVGVFAPGYDFLVDYWSLGCIMFEMLSGYPPFAGPSMEDVWVNLYHWQEVLERPQYEGEDAEFNMTDGAWSLITSLIDHKQRRLSSIQAVYSHPWFHEFNQRIASHCSAHPEARPRTHTLFWTELRSVPAAVVRPPFIPPLKCETDTQNFDDFNDPKSNIIYKEVFEKQKKLQDELDASPGQMNTAVEEEQELANQQNGKQNLMREYRVPYVGFTYKHKQAVNFDNVAAPPPANSSGLHLKNYLRSFYQHK